MQTSVLLQPPSYPTPLYDYCEQCQCLHPATISEGTLIITPCQNRIVEFANDQKVLTQTNVTVPNSHSNSINSISTVSIQNHIVGEKAKPSVISPKKWKNLMVVELERGEVQKEGVGTQGEWVDGGNRGNRFERRRYDLGQLQGLVRPGVQRVRSTVHSAVRPKEHNHIPNALVQNQPHFQSHSPRINYSLPKPILQTRPHLPFTLPSHPFQSCFQTPQFGSQSLVSENNKNNNEKPISSKRLIKQEREFVVPRIADTQKEDENYFCCGYIRKCDR